MLTNGPYGPATAGRYCQSTGGGISVAVSVGGGGVAVGVGGGGVPGGVLVGVGGGVPGGVAVGSGSPLSRRNNQACISARAAA